MKMQKIFKNHESGRSMIEIVGVLAVMGLITAGAFVLIRSGGAAQKRSRAMDEVAAIAENIRGLYAEADDFSDLTDNTTQGTALIDALYLNKTTPFGANTTYTVVKNSDASGFVVKLIGLADEDCNGLAAAAWQNASGAAECVKGIVSVPFSK